jgi:hypothetical protein
MLVFQIIVEHDLSSYANWLEHSSSLRFRREVYCKSSPSALVTALYRFITLVTTLNSHQVESESRFATLGCHAYRKSRAYEPKSLPSNANLAILESDEVHI